MGIFPIVFIYSAGGLGIFFIYFVLPVGTLISAILSVVFAVDLVRDKRNGKALQYSRRRLIISLITFLIFTTILLFVLLYNP